MCEPIVLYRESNAVVMRCPDCGITQLAFGTGHHIFDEKEFAQLREKLAEESKNARLSLSPSKKKFSVPIKDHYSRLWLSANEVLELQNVVEQAAWIGMVKGILESE